ncbi:MAG: helix-turn-helix domain-containing protein [Elusimicrobia bacterium]|nr:helix-turn-helix domain-containing protein [Elusimicrobiota bacterium]
MARKCHKWPLEAKLEAVRARQRGLSVAEVSRLTGLSTTIINESLRIYRKYGVAGLQAGRRR